MRRLSGSTFSDLSTWGCFSRPTQSTWKQLCPVQTLVSFPQIHANTGWLRGLPVSSITSIPSPSLEHLKPSNPSISVVIIYHRHITVIVTGRHSHNWQPWAWYDGHGTVLLLHQALQIPGPSGAQLHTQQLCDHSENWSKVVKVWRNTFAECHEYFKPDFLETKQETTIF